MTSSIGIDSIAKATSWLPNEVCLTLYFNNQEGEDFAARISQLLSPQVGGWQDVGDLKILGAGKDIQTGYRALQHPGILKRYIC